MHDDLESLPLDQKVALRGAQERLLAEFSPTLRPEAVSGVLQSSHRTLQSHATVTHHLPLLAERLARPALATLAEITAAPEGVRTVVFIDHHDAGRAKVAKRLLLGAARPGSVVVATAGSEPLEGIDPQLRDALAASGIRPGQSFPKPLLGRWFTHADAIVVLRTSGLPALPDGVDYELWEISGLSSTAADDVLRLQQQIRERVNDLAVRLGVSAQSAS
jgi:arsenate reductase